MIHSRWKKISICTLKLKRYRRLYVLLFSTKLFSQKELWRAVPTGRRVSRINLSFASGLCKDIYKYLFLFLLPCTDISCQSFSYSTHLIMSKHLSASLEQPWNHRNWKVCYFESRVVSNLSLTHKNTGFLCFVTHSNSWTNFIRYTCSTVCCCKYLIGQSHCSNSMNLNM